MLTLGAIIEDLSGLLPVVDGPVALLAVKFAIAATLGAGGASMVAMFSIWWERKVAGHMQSRLGPMHVGGWHGWAQSIADGLKLVQKEDLMPAGADPVLFRLAPYFAFVPVFAAFVALPFGPQLCFEGSLNNGLLYILAVLALEVVAVIMAGWGSNSKWAVYGAMREACQMVSYEVPLGVSLVCGILVAGTLNLVELGHLQSAGVWDWFVFHNPAMMAAFVIFFIASLASAKRAPFDLPESESELVAGFHTEYSGLRFSFFFFAEYAGMFIIGCIAAFLFLGGWNSPLGMFDPVHYLLGYDPAVGAEAYATGQLAAATDTAGVAEAMGLSSIVSLILLNGYAFTWVILKAFGLVFVQIWLRWTLPRVRIDQVMYACVKVLLPASLIALAGTAAWVALVEPQPVVQWITQITLTAIGGLTLLGIAGIVVMAWLNRDQQPRQTLFPDVMPVGRDVAYTGTPPGPR